MMDKETVIMAMSHNDPIPDVAKTTACAMIQEADMTILQIDNEISRLEVSIEDLKRRRRDTRTRIQRYRSTLAPHRAIPTDILEEIFSHCNPGEIAIPWNLRLLPWVISYVCTKWRSVALGTPYLWRNIQIEDPRYPRTIDMTLELIRRSGNRQVSMIVSNGIYPHTFFDLIATELSCFKHLNITCSPSELMLILSSPSRNITGLEKLHITCPCRVPDLHILEGASSLRELSIPFLVYPASSLSRLSLSRITVLNFSYNLTTSDDVLDLLTQCPAIENCRIRVRSFQPPHEGDSAWSVFV